jgi:hypothetical protein
VSARPVVGAAALALGVPFSGASLDAQSPLTPAAQAAEPTASLSADSVRMAEPFELRVRAHVPAGSTVYFPDTLPRNAEVESFGPVSWRAERAADGGADIALAYPLIPFGIGSVALPSVEVVTTPSRADALGPSLPGGSVVGAWPDAPRGIAAGIVRARSPELSVWIQPMWSAEDVAAGVSPRGPDDVMGLGWSPWTLLFLVVFTAISARAAAPWARAWLARRGRAGGVAPLGGPTLEELRLAALAELDSIAAAPYAAEAEQSLYTATSGAVRGYVERLDPDWGPGLTSTELMESLIAGRETARALASEMRSAERVKFGRFRPGRSAFASHLHTLRSWLSAAPGATEEGPA